MLLEVFAIIGLITSNSSYSGPPLNPDEIYCVAKAVYSESRGEPVMGQVAVAWGIKNRITSKDFPATACGVIYDEKHAVQFPHIKQVKIDYSSPEWESAVEVAGFVWAGFVDDPIDGMRFWYAPKKASKPTWTRFAQQRRIGSHVFYDKESS